MKLDEIHKIEDKYYLVASVKGGLHTKRGSIILVSDKPMGPYKPLTNSLITPNNLDCLDATLFRFNNINWLIYCIEWTNDGFGKIAIQALSDDLRNTQTPPQVIVDTKKLNFLRLFIDPRVNRQGYLTDAPFLFEMQDKVGMLWSSYANPQLAYSGGYTINLITTKKNEFPLGWSETTIIADKNMGHPSLFRDRNGNLLLCCHTNDTLHGQEHPMLLRCNIEDNCLKLESLH